MIDSHARMRELARGMPASGYDTIIVGAGAAGCVLAAQLSEDPARRVLLKKTSVASLIAAPELMLRTRELVAESYMPLDLYVIAALMHFAPAFPLAQAVRLLEQRLGHPR